jgi:NADPH-dependent 2,4-dienoyl-CoA reductase/sulfur reductase-like enzyme/rhodanese-related sulfurtransferase
MATTVIVGGVAGGASCAARLRRNDEHMNIVVLERGPHVSFANCGLPYYVGGVIEKEEDLLLASPGYFRDRFNIDVRTGNSVAAIDRTTCTVRIQRDLLETYDLHYDYLVLAPGAKPIRPSLLGIELPGIFSLRSVQDSNIVKSWISARSVRHAVVIGGGFIGLEVTENLRHLGIDVTLIERSDQIMAALDPEMTLPLVDQIRARNVDLRLRCEVTGFERRADAHKPDALVVRLANGESVNTDMVVLAIGVQPESDLARTCGLEVGRRGHILVNSQMRTSDARIFAVGDAVEVKCAITGSSTALPLAGPANRQGRTAADVIAGKRQRFRGVQGTAVCGVFGMTIASTGLNERALRSSAIPHEVVYAHPRNHVGYYPGATQISMKLLYESSTGRILGAQALGQDGVERRIDVIAMAIQLGAKVFDLEEAELCYAPQYGAAKDPVNMIGMVASNAMRGDMPITHWDQMKSDNAVVLDVRTAEEARNCPMPCSLHIPIDDLRKELGRLPRERPLQVVCAVGIRAYNAIRLLTQHGFKASLLSGGVSTWLRYDAMNKMRR